MTDRDDKAQALDWLIRQHDADFDDWAGFESWLAADPSRADLYGGLAMADADMAALLGAVPPPRAHPRPMPWLRRPRLRNWVGGAMAASIVFGVGFAAWQQRADPYVVETVAGERRMLALADGSRLELNGDTRLVLDRNHDRQIGVERGEVVFTVVHDAARPFRVRVGDATLVDTGTVFDVVHGPDATRVEVAEGSIVFNPDAEAVPLGAGRALVSRRGDERLVLADVRPEAVGAWRRGQLVYDGARLQDIAADLARNLGVPVSVAPAVAGRRFQGVIRLGDDAAVTMAGLATLLDVAVARDSTGWHLFARPA